MTNIMYLLYEQDINNVIKVLAITYDIDDAQIKIAEYAKEFIIKKEGTDKLDIVYQETINDDLPDGYYFLKNINDIIVIKKGTVINVSGWIYNTFSKSAEKIKVKEYKFVEFDKSILPNFSFESKNIGEPNNIKSNMSFVFNDIKNKKVILNNTNNKTDKKIERTMSAREKLLDEIKNKFINKNKN